MAEPVNAFFLPVEPGTRLCIYYPPADARAVRGGMVYVHPFGEEMNKARRMATLGARRLAAAGYAVLQIDLYGCGDSSGDFADARWEAWQRDVRAALQWLRCRVPGPMGLWGLRLGATLAADLAAEAEPGLDQLLLWQPVVSGEQYLTQFLRLHVAAEILSGGSAKTGVRELRAALAAGRSLEIAGLEVHPELTAVLDRLKLAELAPRVKSVRWLEVSGQAEPALAPASQPTLREWRLKGVGVTPMAVAGEPFWATFEITECEALLAATNEAMGGQSSADERGLDAVGPS